MTKDDNYGRQKCEWLRQIGPTTMAKRMPTMIRSAMTSKRMANAGMTAVNDLEELRQRTARTKTTTIKMTAQLCGTIATHA